MVSIENWDTIPKMLSYNRQRWQDRVAMCQKRFGIWERYSWQDCYEKVKDLSMGMVQLGLKPGDVVCIIGDNEPEWFWGEFAVQAAGGVATGIFVDSAPSEVKYIATHSGASFAIVNDQEQTDKFLEIKDDLPELKRVIYWNPKGLKNYDDDSLVSFSEVMEMGRVYDAEAPGFYEQKVAAQKAGDVAFIYYTAGTSDLPKGVMLTHRALLNTGRRFITRYPLDETDDLMSNFPAAWVGDSLFATVPHLLTGARLNFAEKPDTIAEDTHEVGPTLATYGPRQWESLVGDIQSRIIYSSALRRFDSRSARFCLRASSVCFRRESCLVRCFLSAFQRSLSTV